MDDLEQIIERSRSGALSEADRSKLSQTVATLAWLQQEIANKDVTLARLRSLFGLSTSEKTKDVLANAVAAAVGGHEPAKGSNGAGAAGQKSKGHGRNAASDYIAERIRVPHESLKPGDPCPCCPTGKQGKVYGLAKPRQLVRVVGRPPLTATVHELERLRCNLCGEVFVAKAPPGVGEQKYDATAASMIALLKYGSGLPFSRLERLQGNLGIPLPAATQWEIVHEAAEELAPVHQELIRQAAQGRLLHNDDTSMQVLALRREIDRQAAAGETDRTGIFSSSIVSELADGARVALFFTGRKHAGENMAEVLRQRAADLEPPLQMCDGLDRNLPKEFATVLANCLAHGRRKFVEVAGSFPDECRFVLETLRDVYRHDAETRERQLSDEDRLRYHQEHSRHLMADLESWMAAQIASRQTEPNSALGGAIAYMQNRWDKLTLFLRQPGAPLDNNICERALKKAILNRKNAYFYKTENGARVGDLFMSLIHTAELAGENPFEYLAALLDHAADVRQKPDQWLPWRYQATLDSFAVRSPPPP
ncbi:MAG TPA: IS66 family transposase [Planctomycetota bacterium]|nr:IS66 family transposase [Planctomycetota bacterium]